MRPARRRSAARAAPVAYSTAAPATTSAYANQGGRNWSWAKATRPESKGRLIEPLGPSIHSCTPRKPRSPPRVMTKLGTPIRLWTWA